MRTKRDIVAVIAALCVAATVGAADEAFISTRYGALFYPGEVAAFSVPLGADAWRVVDCDGIERGRGKMLGTKLALSESAIGNRVGAFRLDVMGGGVTNSMWFARLTSRKVEPCPWAGTGTHAHHGWGKGDLRFVDLIAAAGLGWVRDEPLWESCERTKGSLVMPKTFDAYVGALYAKCIRMNLLLTYGNKCYANPCDAEGFARFAGFCAAHFRGRVDRFEIWNEPQYFGFAKQYAKGNDNAIVWVKPFVSFTHQADEAIHAANPDAVVNVAVEDQEYLLDMMLANGIARRHNAISFHPYCHSQHCPERTFFLKDFGTKHRALAAANGGADHWCVTEAGWCTYVGTGTYWHVAGGYPRASHAGQAACVVRMYLSALAAGCEYACQYDFMDDGPRRDFTEHNFGLVHQDGTPKPAFAAVAFMTRFLGDATFDRELSTKPDEFRMMRFRRGDSIYLACWAVEGTCTVDLPESFGSASKCFDFMGNVVCPPLSGKRVLTLTERPIYLTEFQRKEE